MTYAVFLTPTAQEMIAEIGDRRIQAKVVETAQRLASDHEKQGKPLTGLLAGYRSLRAVGQRYRIIYRVDNNRVIVIVVGAGIRKQDGRDDIYFRIQKLLRLKLL